MRRLSWMAFSWLVAASLTATLTGCGEDWQAQTFPVSGRLTINGQPATGALVQLVATGAQPDVRNSRPWGVVGPDGAFHLATYEPGSGAPAGDYGLTITWPVDSSVLGSPDRLQGKYADPATYRQPVTIKGGPTAIPPIELTRVIVAQNPRAAAAVKRLHP